MHKVLNIIFCNKFSHIDVHEMPARTSDEKGVCPSVRPFVKRVDCDKIEERSVQIFYRAAWNAQAV